MGGSNPFYLIATYFEVKKVNQFYNIKPEARTEVQSNYLRVYNLLLDVTEFRRSAKLYTFYESDISDLSKKAHHVF